MCNMAHDVVIDFCKAMTAYGNRTTIFYQVRHLDPVTDASGMDWDVVEKTGDVVIAMAPRHGVAS